MLNLKQLPFIELDLSEVQLSEGDNNTCHMYPVSVTCGHSTDTHNLMFLPDKLEHFMQGCSSSSVVHKLIMTSISQSASELVLH